MAAQAFIQGYQPYPFTDFSGGLGLDCVVLPRPPADDVVDAVSSDAELCGVQTRPRFHRNIGSGVAVSDVRRCLLREFGVRAALHVPPARHDLKVIGVHAAPIAAGVI